MIIIDQIINYHRGKIPCVNNKIPIFSTLPFRCLSTFDKLETGFPALYIIKQGQF